MIDYGIPGTGGRGQGGRGGGGRGQGYRPGQSGNQGQQSGGGKKPGGGSSSGSGSSSSGGSKTDSLANLTKYSRNDIVYCSAQVVNAASKIASAGGGAHMMSMVNNAKSITSAPEPLEATMMHFIKSYFGLLDPGFFAKSHAGVTDEERQCMKALYWMESLLAQDPNWQNIQWNSSDRIYVAPPANTANANNASASANANANANMSNQANEILEAKSGTKPFYKETWFVALGSTVGIGAAFLVVYNMFKPQNVI